MDRVMDEDFIEKAVALGIKKYELADLCFEGHGGMITEEMKEYAQQHEAETVLSYDTEVVEIPPELGQKGVVVLLNGKEYSVGLFGYDDGYSLGVAHAFYVHSKGVQLLYSGYEPINFNILICKISNIDKYLEDDGLRKTSAKQLEFNF